MHQVSLTGTHQNIERIEQTLLDCGALSVTFQDAADEPVLEPAPGETPLWSLTRIVALFEDDSDAGLQQRLRTALDNDLGNDTELSVEDLPARDWTRAWMADFKPMRFGERLWIVPSSHTPPDPAAANILLDPGLAFGSGTHPTTALCLEWLEANITAGQRLLDYGCGCGVLGLAALKLGAGHVIAVDIDPQALTATRDNAGNNTIAPEQIEVLHPDELADQAHSSRVDVVVANILSGPLIELAPHLAAWLPAGGRIALAGILDEQANDVITAYAHWFEMSRGPQREQWVLLAGQKRAA